MIKRISIILGFVLLLSLMWGCAKTAGPDSSTSDETQAPAEDSSYPVYALKQYTNLLGRYDLDDYELNDAGQITAYKVYEVKSGKRSASPTSVVITYDNAGNPVKVRYESYSGYEELMRTFDDKGNVTRETWSSDYSLIDGRDFVYTYIFDSDGRISEETATSADASNYIVRTYNYAKDGTVLSYTEKNYEPDGSLHSDWLIEVECDGNGNITKQNVIDNEDPSGGWINTFEYDEIGNGSQMQPPCSRFRYIYPEWL